MVASEDNIDLADDYDPPGQYAALRILEHSKRGNVYIFRINWKGNHKHTWETRQSMACDNLIINYTRNRPIVRKRIEAAPGGPLVFGKLSFCLFGFVCVCVCV